jgi:hypothetical protein
MADKPLKAIAASLGISYFAAWRRLLKNKGELRRILGSKCA